MGGKQATPETADHRSCWPGNTLKTALPRRAIPAARLPPIVGDARMRAAAGSPADVRIPGR
jgi:hypothetical protein